VELKDVFESCNIINIETLESKTFTKQECNFGYRNSIFKNEEKGNFIITDVNFILTKKNHHLKIEYGAIKEKLAQLNIASPTLLEISNTIISIRQSKLPDPKALGNSGSFFKNPIIDNSEFKKFINLFPEAPYYEISKTEYKIPAGWLIEKAGFKGKRFGDAGVHKNQALVLVNFGTATGTEIINLAHKIQTEVKNIFNISIEPEVNII
jgi:UDP-N-acetylmuramate dehydrogenase